MEASAECPVRLDHAAYRAMMEANALPLNGRVEMIRGVLVPMSPAFDAHGSTQSYVCMALAPVLKRGLKTVIDASLFLKDDVTVAADLVVLPKTILSQEAKGSDLLFVIEVATSSLSYDTGEKADIYAANDVQDYLVVDVNDRKSHLFRDPSPDGYRSIAVEDWSVPIEPLAIPGLVLTLSEIIDP